MPLVEYYKLVVLERYAQFDGRAGRAQFWWFVLANFIVQFVLQILVGVADIFVILLVIYALALIVPSIAVAVRRLHDTGKSGWFILIGLIPIVGVILLIVFYATEGDAGANEYGEPDPGLPAAA